MINNKNTVMNAQFVMQVIEQSYNYESQQEFREILNYVYEELKDVEIDPSFGEAYWQVVESVAKYADSKEMYNAYNVYL